MEPQSVDTGDLGKWSSHFLCKRTSVPVVNEFEQNSLALCLREALLFAVSMFWLCYYFNS